VYTYDILGRAFAQELSREFGQPVIVENRGGAGTAIGAQAVATARPDGYTMLLGTGTTYVLNPALRPNNLSYDPVRDFTMVSIMAEVPIVFIINPQLPVRSLAELVGYARANPGKINFSSAGSGTSSHLAGVLFGMRMAIEVQHVPYRGTAPSMAAVMNGETLFAIGAAPASRQQVLGGLLKALGVSTAQRSSTMPEVATLQEQGVPNFDVSSWYGIAAPAGVPMAIRERLGAEVVAALQEQSIVQRIRDFGAEAWPLGPSDYDRFMRREVDTWAPIVQASGVQID